MFGLYKHYKGGYYIILGSGYLSEDRNQKMIIYYSLSKRCIWLRPFGMFKENVNYKNMNVPRFKKILGF